MILSSYAFKQGDITRMLSASNVNVRRFPASCTPQKVMKLYKKNHHLILLFTFMYFFF